VEACVDSVAWLALDGQIFSRLIFITRFFLGEPQTISVPPMRIFFVSNMRCQSQTLVAPA
jgi:hypothetical protein